MTKCKTCMFYSTPSLKMSTCKRYPPTIFKPYGESFFPLVSEDNWCGEYEPNKERFREIMKECDEKFGKI